MAPKTTATMSTHDLRRLVGRSRARCVFCQQYVEWDPPADVADPQQVGDWNDDGDYGCDANPETGEEGTGGHLTAQDVSALSSDLERMRTTLETIASGNIDPDRMVARAAEALR